MIVVVASIFESDLSSDDGVSGAVALEEDLAACKLKLEEKCDEKVS